MNSRVLVVDDYAETRQAIKKVLEHEDLHVVLAESAEDALTELSRSHFDLVISDLQMKGKSGLDLVRETRSRGVATPFVLISARADQAVRQAAEPIRSVAVLDKPLRKQILLEYVSRALANVDSMTAEGPIPPCRSSCPMTRSLNFCPYSRPDET